MTQTLAIFYEAYRSLNAKKMFWVVLAISVIVAAVFFFASVNEDGYTVLTWQINSPWTNTNVMSTATFYKQNFINWGIGFWLTWLASILALISTAGLFPDLLNSGSLNLLVSKPISRLRLFLTQYAAGLLFVVLQVLLFTLICFLVIGLRGGAWEPGLFLAVPLVVCFFSYLFSVCALLGMLTRSTLASLLLTILFWFAIFLLGGAERLLVNQIIMQQRGITSARMGFMPPRPNRRTTNEFPPAPPAKPLPTFHDIPKTETPDELQPEGKIELPSDKQDNPEPESQSASQPAADGAQGIDQTKLDDDRQNESQTNAPAGPQEPQSPPQTQRDSNSPDIPQPQAYAQPQSDAQITQQLEERDDRQNEKQNSDNTHTLELVHDILYYVLTVLPKTTETVALLERNLLSVDELTAGPSGRPEEMAAARETAETLRSRSVWWIIGTSLGFEAAALGCAAFIFCRRDY
jgi:ABC-type transport system involved in multi-copper enzyme maturation permease subunit